MLSPIDKMRNVFVNLVYEFNYLKDFGRYL